MVVRNLLEPVDLFAAVPKTGQIQPGHYMDALRQRFAPIAGQTDVANQLTQYQLLQRDQQQYQSMFDQARQGRDSAGNALQNWRPPNVSLGSQVANYGRVGNGNYTGAYVNPVSGYRPSGHWGSYPVSGRPHNALDFAVPLNTRVGAPVSGRVVVAGWDSGGFGNSLRIDQGNGNYWILGHLNSLGVKVGQQVHAGDFVGYSGSTGRSTGPHLHVEARHDLWNPSSAFNFSSLFGW